MTPKELAENIFAIAHGPEGDRHERILRVLSAALEEAKNTGREQVWQHWMGDKEQNSIRAVKAAAYEDAAKIAEARCQCPHHISIGYEIRRRAEKLK